MIPGFVWTVPALVLEWKDGDTCEVKLDQGWRVSRERQSVRLLNLWCAETDSKDPARRAEAFAALAHAIELVPPGSIVIVTSKAVRTGLWGGTQESLSRTLGDIRLLDGRDFATVMVADGYGTHSETGTVNA